MSHHTRASPTLIKLLLYGRGHVLVKRLQRRWYNDFHTKTTP